MGISSLLSLYNIHSHNGVNEGAATVFDVEGVAALHAHRLHVSDDLVQTLLRGVQLVFADCGHVRSFM